MKVNVDKGILNSNPAKGIEKAGQTEKVGSEKAGALKGRSSAARPEYPVEISDEARLMNTALEIARRSPDKRMDRIQELKGQIARGEYKPDAVKVAEKLLEDHLTTDFGKNNL